MKNIDLLHLLFEVMKELTGKKVDEKLITYTADRPGHDFRYAMDAAKLKKLGYSPIWSLKTGLNETIKAYTSIT